ncbi:glycosyltransferase [Chitinophaga pendula]|uniref:glycosyltransferase family 2 protein n=1 Tax=Chitinophaga TaxID=79328 RepID=UPI000BAE9187|nr:MULTISPECIES: glycosyltransferase [Chitinophaga]ASZ13823.1 family 2 glycosyl transferase [Chitinophaga sp. MD30]UCJ08556.1 glycosyltransferase [Chitinophaga pendula]
MAISISVIVPTYKRPRLLMQCLQALAAQDFDKSAFEVIIVSDGPDTLAKQLVLSWKHSGVLQVEYLPLPAKRGPAAARNLGWQRARGTLIAFTDDDCQPDIHWLQQLWSTHIHYQSAPLQAYTGRIIVPMPEELTDFALNTAQLEQADFVTANCACTREALLLTGGFDERFAMAWREDSDLEFKLIDHDICVIHVSDAIVVHPVRAATWGVSLREQRKCMFNALLYKKFPVLYRTKIAQWPPKDYYLMIASFMVLLLGVVTGQLWVALGAMMLWLLLLVLFIRRRLAVTSRRPSHVFEMIITSTLIPFLSVYWNWYGAWRYKVLFI